MGVIRKRAGEPKGLRVGSVIFGVVGGFVLGFIAGAGIVAILDYRDEKIARLYKLRHDTDENYIYSE
jgi:capsular polysaccharide biosynthesis protein